ncbi:MAG TPA: hypothetical protein VMX17_16895 [Candidatus Glassbacteria bacterium]|nr:hypothetical protein [Candidatus Glassbacteria bacterium]
MPSRFSEVVPDMLYRGGAPDPKEIPVLKNEWGVEKIISLDEESGLNIEDVCKKNKIKHVMLPIHGPNSEKIMKYINDVGAADLIGDDVTFVHCKHGKDRTGMFIGRYRTDTDTSAKKALEEAVAFGFGLGVDDDKVEEYLEVINNGKYAEESMVLNDYKALSKDAENCSNCGMVLLNGTCSNCSKNMFVLNLLRGNKVGDAVSESQYASSMNPGDTINRSDLWSVPESSPESMAYMKNNIIRRGLIKSFNKKLLEAQHIQHITRPISAGEKKKARELIKTLQSFSDLLNTLIAQPINKMLDLFKNSQGITFEVMEKSKSTQHFKSFGINMKKNMWRLVGARYIDTIKELKPSDISEEKADSFKTLFDKCVDELGFFSTDTQMGPMQQTLKETVKGLVDLTIDLGNYMELNLKDKEFQLNATNILIETQKQCAKIKSIVQDRIIRKIAKDVIGDDVKETDNKENVSLNKDRR